MTFLKYTLAMALFVHCVPGFAAMNVTQLRCEYRTNPLGVDVDHPRLSWILAADDAKARGLRQTSYQILAASSPETLAGNKGDLWDSGKVSSDQTTQIAYHGKALKTSQHVFWKARVWDQNGKLSAWGHTAEWTMGILTPQEWQAHWIGAESVLPASDSTRKFIGYHAAEASREDDVKWVQIDLGSLKPISAIRLYPMAHADKAGFGFPIRFKVEVAREADFTTPTVIADRTAADFPSPGVTPVAFDAHGISARYVRVTVTKIWKRDTMYAFALSQLEVVSNGQNVAKNTAVTAKDSVEDFGWGKSGLTDGTTKSQPDPTSVASISPKGGTVLLRREFDAKPKVRRAVVTVCGLGQYELYLNGHKVGDEVLAPGWTKYNKTCQYTTYDVTTMLNSGHNAIGLFLGDGMYNVVSGGRYNKFVGSFGPLTAIAQIRIEYPDGSTQIVGTDERWRATSGPITFSSPYGGEDYDARLEPNGWKVPGFSDTNWSMAIVTNGPGGVLKGISCAAPPIHTYETFDPVSIKQISPTVAVYDLGQNASIMPKLTVSGPTGSVIRLTPSELVHSDGTLDRASVGNANSYWQYTLAGSGTESYFPYFFYHGCRYLQVECIPATPQGMLPKLGSLKGVVIQAASPSVGTFETSSDLFNRIHTLIRWAQRSNMVSVMTDCPHRERLGWLEEDHLNGPSLRYGFDMSMLFTKQMNDMGDSQLDNGLVPSIAPEYPVFGGDFRDSPEWGSAFLLVARQQYEFDGDVDLLRRHFDGMKRYVDYLTTKAKGNLVEYGLGDWYDIGPNPPGYSQLTPRGLTATAFYYNDALVLSKTAALLGNTQDAAKYDELAKQIRTAFNAKFFNATTNQYATGSQCANSIPLVMGLAESQNRQAVLDNVVKDVRDRGNAITAGDVGYRYLLRALADGGRSDVIFDMNNQSDKPGYGYQLKQGATSLTEAWNALRSSSQNHFMLGQIMEWFYHDLAGIQNASDSAGFQKIVIKPAIIGDLTWVKADYDSVHGKITSAWKRSGSKITLDVTIPPNTTATVCVPAKNVSDVTEGLLPVSKAMGVKFLRTENNAAMFEVGSGQYHFVGSL